MVQGVKDGSLAKLLSSSGEECLPWCVIMPIVILTSPAWTAPAVIAAENAEKEGGCFSSSSTVQTPSGVIAIKNLRLNDSVLTFTPGVGAHYTEVHSHSHVVSYQKYLSLNVHYETYKLEKINFGRTTFFIGF